ncbi:lysis protein [Caballeronia sp. SEWSISQ10-4 2]|uniref:lysis protein n=1 Tax=Caballeronia sp. SEWSISQ10-4 2 TaxID=2937438 RepID=UPI002656A983|nr:lysis protein [Caballeronia sp. SEWSISQ10-4 2]MDN7179123.1 lysis protein [Caballeronia sp. SEWSISQ10-4 2]
MLAKAIAVLVAAALLFGAGWTVNGWRADAEINTLKSGYDKTAADATEKARATEQGWQKKVADIDKQRSKELEDAKLENARLSAAVAAGDVRLRVRASCSASSGLPQAPGAAGMADEGTAELDSDARQDYFALRDQLAESEKQIFGLQDYINTVLSPQ